VSRAVWRQADAVTESNIIRDAAYGEPLGRVGALVLPEAENLVGNPSFETNANGWLPANSNLSSVLAADEGIPAMFGDRVLKVTAVRSAIDQHARYQIVFTEMAHAGQARIYIPSAYDGVAVVAYSASMTSGNVDFPASMGIRDAWQSVGGVFTPGGPDLDGFWAIRGSNASIGASFYVDGCIVTEGPLLWPYFDGSFPNCTWDGTEHASASTRIPGEITIAADLPAASFGAALGFASLYDSAALPAGEYVVYDRRDSADNRITLAYERPENRWALHRYAGGSDDPLYVADTFTAGTVKHLAIGGDAEHLYLQVDGGTRNAGDNAMPLVLTSTSHDIGQAGGLGALPADWAYAIPYWRAYTEAEGAHFASLSRPPHTGDVPRVVLP